MNVIGRILMAHTFLPLLSIPFLITYVVMYLLLQQATGPVPTQSAKSKCTLHFTLLLTSVPK